MPKRLLLILCILACGLMLVPASASTAPAPKGTPVVTGISPARVGIGDLLVIKGRNFVKGTNRNTVVFQRDRARAIFVRAERSTSTRITLRIPAKLRPFLANRNSQPQPTRFRIRVLARRFGASFTSTRLSPVITPSSTRQPVVLPPSLTGPEGDCDNDGVKNQNETDADNDLLPDAIERTLKTNFCSPDTDGDSLEDGFEWESAYDLNCRATGPATPTCKAALPFPGKRPYPNPLDSADANVDHDGDGMTNWQEHMMWARFGNRSLPLLYSAGTQNTNGPAPVNEPQLDRDGSGTLSDDERDVDGDGLGNWTEANGPMVFGWWLTWYKDEKPYPVQYPTVDFVDRDSDGDGLRDGDDDVDHDDFTNIEEAYRTYASQGLWVQPHNPCLPHPYSRTCNRYHPPPSQSYPPFDEKTPRPFPAVPLPCPYPSIASPGPACQPSTS
jgi:hypothetical protein